MSLSGRGLSKAFLTQGRTVYAQAGFDFEQLYGSPKLISLIIDLTHP